MVSCTSVPVRSRYKRILPWWCGLLSLLLVVMTGCQFTQSGFSRTAGNVGSTFSAASTTLSYAHEGKITYAYARSSFVNFQDQLSGVDQQLSSQGGASDKPTLQHLLSLYSIAMQVVNQPCLQDSCTWRTQVAALNQASQAFLKAGGS